MTDPDGALALSEFRREVGIGLARIEGDLRLMLQRSEQGEKRIDDLTRLVAALDERVDTVEREQVTRTDLDKRNGRTISILTLVMTAVSILSATATAVIIAIVN